MENEIDDLPDPVVSNPPREIFLNVGDIEEDCDFDELDEISWSVGQIYEADVQYILASTDVSGLMAKIYQLEEQISRLEDLRRWRPMTEAPNLPPRAYVLGKRADGDFEKIYRWSDEEWYGDGGLLDDHELFQTKWTYIPGQEPADA